MRRAARAWRVAACARTACVCTLQPVAAHKMYRCNLDGRRPSLACWWRWQYWWWCPNRGNLARCGSGGPAEQRQEEEEKKPPRR